MLGGIGTRHGVSVVEASPALTFLQAGQVGLSECGGQGICRSQDVPPSLGDKELFISLL